MSLGRHVVLALICVLATTPGCGHFRRVARCRRLADHVNQTLDSIAAQNASNGVSAASYRAIATRYEQLGRDVETFSSDDDNLGRALKDYDAFFQDTGRTLRVLADALDRKDMAGAARIRRDAGTLMRRDRSLAARVDAACSEP